MSALQPMTEAPTSGPVFDILIATVDKHGNRRWVIAHYADSDGDGMQPPFRGWFFWAGHSYSQLTEGEWGTCKKMLGWSQLPEIPR